MTIFRQLSNPWLMTFTEISVSLTTASTVIPNPNLGSFTIPNGGSNADGVLTDTNIGTTWSTIVADGGIVNW